MRVLITAIGSHGDINPFIGVGRALLARGHSAALISNPYFKGQVEEAGLEFIPLGEALDLRDLKDMPDVMHPRKAAKVVVNELMLPFAEQTLRELPGIMDAYRPDAVMHHHICIATAWVCEKRAVPTANAVLAPMMWMSRADTFSPMWWSPLHPPKWFRWTMTKLFRPLIKMQMSPPFNRLRREHGLKPLDDCWRDACRNGTVNLGLWSREFRGPVDGDPEQGVICGFPLHDRHGEQEHAGELVERFLAAGPEPVLFSLGTAAVHVARDFYQIASDACRLMGRRGMLLVGNSGVTVKDPPPGVAVFTYIPFSKVMPRVAASVHHGGIGTTAQGLRAGKPTVIVPHAHDQFDNAARAKRLGVSETVIRGRLTARRLADAVMSVLENPTARANATVLAARLKTEDGAAVAADCIEKLAGSANTQPTPALSSAS
ncbi:MAG TPA: glycosyltransferase [Phycisphaerales bacterium]|nr:glycosyltransferase [Phycisphaerales bacterium]